jgi:tRNA pseudouridine-54 N-methylase
MCVIDNSEISSQTISQSVSHQERGVCDIEVEISSPQNPLFVLHDSMGFEPGQSQNFEKAQNFLQSCSGNSVPLHTRVHAIWCVASTLDVD